MTARRVPDAPSDLSEERAGLFRRLAGDLVALEEGAEVDFVLLAEACRRLDRLDAVRRVLAEDGVTVTGSKGQVRPHGLLAVEAGLSRDVLAAFDKLKLSPATRPTGVVVGRGGRLSL